MFRSPAVLRKSRGQTRHASRSQTRTHIRVLAIIAALIATGALASQLTAQSESKMYYSPCGGGVLEACGEETTYSDCGWSFKGYFMSAFPYVGVIPWYGCDTETSKTLYKNYYKSAGELQEM